MLDHEIHSRVAALAHPYLLNDNNTQYLLNTEHTKL